MDLKLGNFQEYLEAVIEDEDEQEDSDEPQEEDITISPYGSLGSRLQVSVVGGKPIGIFSDQDAAEKAIKKYMDQHNFYPQVWMISDHGNAHRIQV